MDSGSSSAWTTGGCTWYATLPLHYADRHTISEISS